MPIEENKNNILLKLLSRYQLVVNIVIVLLMVVLGWIFLIQPNIEAHQSNPELTLEYQQEVLAQRQERLQHLNTLIADYKRLPPSHFVKINELLPQAKDNPLIFAHLDALARAEDSVLLSVSADELGDRELTTLLISEGIEAPENIKVVQIDASFLGKTGLEGYPYYKKLVGAIENNLRLFDIQYINFSPGDENITISARTYYLQGK